MFSHEMRPHFMLYAVDIGRFVEKMSDSIDFFQRIVCVHVVHRTTEQIWHSLWWCNFAQAQLECGQSFIFLRNILLFLSRCLRCYKHATYIGFTIAVVQIYRNIYGFFIGDVSFSVIFVYFLTCSMEMLKLLIICFRFLGFIFTFCGRAGIHHGSCAAAIGVFGESRHIRKMKIYILSDNKCFTAIWRSAFIWCIYEEKSEMIWIFMFHHQWRCKVWKHAFSVGKITFQQTKIQCSAFLLIKFLI